MPKHDAAARIPAWALAHDNGTGIVTWQRGRIALAAAVAAAGMALWAWVAVLPAPQPAWWLAVIAVILSAGAVVAATARVVVRREVPGGEA